MCRAVHKLKSKGKKKDEKLNVATKFSQNEVKKKHAKCSCGNKQLKQENNKKKSNA